MTCKQCGNELGKFYYELTEVTMTYRGDRDERSVTDAGVFCSGYCVGAYLISEESTPTPSPGGTE